jgi:dephospho-CoA kinase
MTAEQAALRIAAQRPQSEKIAHASAVIDNNGTLDDLAHQVATAWHQSVAPHLAR